MADKSNGLERGEYIIGIAIILAALLVSATVYVGAADLKSAISAIKLTAPAAATGAAVQQPAAQQPAAQAAPQGDWSFVATAPSIGPANAKVTVIAFADFQCPFCGITYGNPLGGTRYDAIRGTATKIADEYAKAGKVRFVFQTMAFLGQESIDAGNAAFCAREIGGDEGFFKMHDKLFESQQGENEGTFNKTALKKFAADIGFNSTAMASCIDSGKYNGLVAQSTTQANAVGVEGTPSFAVNGQIVSGGAEYTVLKAAVDAALAK